MFFFLNAHIFSCWFLGGGGNRCMHIIRADICLYPPPPGIDHPPPICGAPTPNFVSIVGNSVSVFFIENLRCVNWVASLVRTCITIFTFALQPQQLLAHLLRFCVLHFLLIPSVTLSSRFLKFSLECLYLSISLPIQL